MIVIRKSDEESEQPLCFLAAQRFMGGRHDGGSH